MSDFVRISEVVDEFPDPRQVSVRKLAKRYHVHWSTAFEIRQRAVVCAEERAFRATHGVTRAEWEAARALPGGWR